MSAKAGPHFTPELFRFLRQLERNNSREWFEKNKPHYLEHVREPMQRFIADFGPKLRRISPHFLADPRPQGGSMFRIYRDVRFSRDKRPYKTAASAQFRHVRGKDVHAPGFYVHLGTDAVFAGTGLWRPASPTLLRLRRTIAENPAAWNKILRAKAFRETLKLGGESLKRAPKGFAADHPLIEDLKRKDFVTFAQLDEKAACSADFLDRFAGICRAARPFVRFLTEGVGLEF